MYLAIGDVVVDRSTRLLGIVSGVTRVDDGNVVAVQLSGGGLHIAAPQDLDLVGRSVQATTPGRTFGFVAFALGVAAAFPAGGAALGLGAGWWLALFTGAGAFAAVATVAGLIHRLARPRRIRV